VVLKRGCVFYGNRTRRDDVGRAQRLLEGKFNLSEPNSPYTTFLRYYVPTILPSYGVHCTGILTGATCDDDCSC
jgi:hypothetical protein